MKSSRRVVQSLPRCRAGDPKDKASYIHKWIQVLKNYKNEVFRDAADAPKACDYLYSLENGKVKESAATHAERVTAQAQERQVRSR
jgi:antirestriction protein ArdC